MNLGSVAESTATLVRIARKLRSLRVIDNRELHLLHEQFHLCRLLKLLDVDCVFDVGANYGQYASMLRQKAGFKGLIISFEPIPDAATKLFEMARHDPHWVVEGIALSRESGTTDFHIMASSRFSSLGTPRHDEVKIFGQNRIVDTVVVRTETLGSAFQRLQAKLGFKRPFLKLDTQGFDVEIINSGRDVIPNFVGLQSELAVKKIYDQSVDFRQALSIYQSLGFELSALVPNNAGHFPSLIELDCIMLRADLSAPSHA